MFKTKKLLRQSIGVNEKMVATLNVGYELIKEISELMLQQSKELRNDCICGAWTDCFRQSSVSVCKIPNGYRATVFRLADGRKTIFREYFIEFSGGALRASLVREAQPVKCPPLFGDTVDSEICFWDNPREQSTDIPVEIGKTEDYLKIGSSDRFYRDENLFVF